jgi:hypothetical protein
MKPWMAISTIEYRPDLTAPAAPKIPLGFLMEIKTPNVHLVGLIARTALTAREKAQLDGIARVQLEEPDKYLSRECNRAFASATDGVIAYLAQQHAWALKVSAPLTKDAPASFVKLRRPEAIVSHAQQWLVRQTRAAEVSKEDATRAGRKKPARARASRSSASSRRYSYSVTLQDSCLSV